MDRRRCTVSSRPFARPPATAHLLQSNALAAARSGMWQCLGIRNRPGALTPGHLTTSSWPDSRRSSLMSHAEGPAGAQALFVRLKSSGQEARTAYHRACFANRCRTLPTSVIVSSGPGPSSSAAARWSGLNTVKGRRLHQRRGYRLPGVVLAAGRRWFENHKANLRQATDPERSTAR